MRDNWDLGGIEPVHLPTLYAHITGTSSPISSDIDEVLTAG